MKSTKNILITTYWSFDNALIQTYTLPYVKLIKDNLSADSSIYILTLNNPSYFNNSAQYKKQIDELAKNRIYILSFKYKEFNLSGALYTIYYLTRLTIFIFKNNINYIHAWCTPGGAIGYILSVLTKRPLVLDSFEPHAETMIEAGIWDKKSLAFKLLFKLEKLQLKRAKEVICTVDAMSTYSQKTYAVNKERYFAKPACVDLNNFKANTSAHNIDVNDNHIICVYAGKFGDIYLEKETFEFFKTAYDYFNGNLKILLLTAQSTDYIHSYCNLVGLPRQAVIIKYAKHFEVSNYLSMAHFAICPVKPLPSKRFCTPIKNGEYWAMGLPVIITKDISDDSEIIENNNIGYVLRELDTENYLAATKHIDLLLKTEPHLKAKIKEIAKRYRSFEIAKNIYETIYG